MKNNCIDQVLDLLELKLTKAEIKLLFDCVDQNPEIFITELFDLLYSTEKEIK